jgi:hypothetical protein
MGSSRRAWLMILCEKNLAGLMEGVYILWAMAPASQLCTEIKEQGKEHITLESYSRESQRQRARHMVRKEWMVHVILKCPTACLHKLMI